LKSQYFVIILIICFSLNIFAQPIESREKTIFNKGIEFYKNGNFKEAENSFNLVIKRLPDSRYITAYFLMLAKSQYKLKNYSGAINQSKVFLEKFPKSKYVGDIFTIQGDSYYRLKRYETALETWFKALEYSHEYQLMKILKNRIVNTLASYYSQKEIENISILANTSDVDLAKDMAKYIKFLGTNPKKGKQILNNSISQNSKSAFYSDAKALLNQEKSYTSNSMKIALLLPLTGFNEKIGKEIKEGIDFAVEKFNSKNNVNIEILLNDYGESISSAIIGLKRIAQDKSIIGIYGPIENDFSAACAVISEYEQLPVFSPIATGNKLTQISPYFYQLNNSIAIQAAIVHIYI